MELDPAHLQTRTSNPLNRPRVSLEAKLKRDPVRWLGRVLMTVRFNSIGLEIHGDARHWKKARLRRGDFLVPLANWFAARTGMKMRVLTRSSWLRHEPLMYRLLLGRPVDSSSRAILLPNMPGCTLRRMLCQSPQLNFQNEMAISLAATELARLHACHTPHPCNGRPMPFSHADATIDNVLIDLEQHTACWIDFETAHPPWLAPVVRHADDLLTMLYNSAAMLPDSALRRLCNLVLLSYGSPAVTEAMIKTIQFWHRRPTARGLAFPWLNNRRWTFFHDAVAAAAVRPGFNGFHSQFHSISLPNFAP